MAAENFLRQLGNSFPWDADMRQQVEDRRATRGPENTLMIDVLLAGYEESPGFPLEYPPTDSTSLETLVQAVETNAYDKASEIFFYFSLDTGDRHSADQYAWTARLSDYKINRIKGFWALDRDQYQQAVDSLSTYTGRPDENSVSAFDTENEMVIHTLSGVQNSKAQDMILKFHNAVRPTLHNRELRDAYLKALMMKDFTATWKWIKDEKFRPDLLKETPESTVMGQDFSSDRDSDPEFVEECTKESNRLLVVLLDHALKPYPKRYPLEKLSTVPVDDAQEKALLEYLLDPDSGLPQASFEILQDLLTTRLLSFGRYSESIDLDRKVSDLVRTLNNRSTDKQMQQERRQMVDVMISILPRVQRELLAAEKDYRGLEDFADQPMSWAHAALVTNTTESEPSDNGPSTYREPPSRRVVSLSGLLGQSPARDSNHPSANLFQTILYNQHLVASRSAAAASDTPRKTKTPTRETISPRPSQPEYRSPFSGAIKLARGPVASPLFHSSRSSFRVSTQEQDSGDRSLDVESQDGEATPVPQRRKRTLQLATIDSGLHKHADAMDVDETDEGNTEKGRKGLPIKQSSAPESSKGKRKTRRSDMGQNQLPALPSNPPATTSRYETRARRISTAPSETPTETITETPGKPRRRTRLSVQPSVASSVPDFEPPTPRATRKRASQAGPSAQEDRAVAPKRSRKTIAATPHESMPPPVTRTARTTRSQSVMSEATTEAGDETLHRHPITRAAKRSSVAPSSPAKSEVGVRTRRASRQPSEAPSNAEGVRTRRQSRK